LRLSKILPEAGGVKLFGELNPERMAKLAPFILRKTTFRTGPGLQQEEEAKPN
jgi:hypothetical protein